MVLRALELFTETSFVFPLYTPAAELQSVKLVKFTDVMAADEAAEHIPTKMAQGKIMSKIKGIK
jgi:hypothetical protein